MKNPFPCHILFWFENDSKIIAEIKLTGIQSEDKSLIYKWLIIQKENSKKVSVLTFLSMGFENNKQIRHFAEGILEWNAKEASFHGEKLVPIDTQLADEKWIEAIERFLE